MCRGRRPVVVESEPRFALRCGLPSDASLSQAAARVVSIDETPVSVTSAAGVSWLPALMAVEMIFQGRRSRPTWLVLASTRICRYGMRKACETPV